MAPQSKQLPAEEYRSYVVRRLAGLEHLFTRASIGDFSQDVQLPKEDDEFTTLYAGVQVMIEAVREKVGELQELNRQLTGKVGELRELTTRLRTEQARDRAILLGMGEGLVVVDERGIITMANQAFESMMGWTSQEAMGKYLPDVLPAQDESGQRIPNTERPLSKAFKMHETIMTGVGVNPYYYVRRDGTRFPVAITVSPFMSRGRVIGSINVFRDITREQDIDRAKSEFVSLASHQLRTPLTIIRWSADILKRYAGKLSPQQEKYVTAVEEAGRQMVNLVDALLNVSRIEAGSLRIEPKPVDVKKLVDGILRELQPLIDTQQLRMRTRVAADLPKLQVDPELTRVVIHNLITNAIKYTKQRGQIFITVARDAANIKVSVRDTGVGIPVEDQPKIFSKLYRAENVMQLEPHGTGLGLYIAKAVVEQSGGRIWFESKENSGTTFTFTLPLRGVQKKTGTKIISPG